ncbi:HEAT repeat protein [Streptomyces sp. SAI-208]|uniref:HEAT repeat domain-containing protein n=1 Tax=unclassified Streptomyces TaxID=2593676 RepID=UPI0024743A8D|nr:MULTISPECIES: HEAT repeat domain-containing protein [unclassified Streptomyces]MDH6553803.1 HEAT repeat protein [Streptomyces sp. SAI-041]MDH6572882.1 HEAT repeat protein [Streptomyces sp. SAI-117]MDH6582156.1 HEAT repeat protein [Streptomyces sp. SAI-133]MDH6612585.1 HEAT repeat protein [Streptomyces sp. SAI-208]
MTAEHQVAFFLRELETGDTWGRAAAAKGLGRLGTTEHATVLVRAAADPAPEVREGAAVGLGRLGVSAGMAETLCTLMDDDDPWVRRQASLASRRLGLRDRAVVEAYGRLLGDPDHHLRINALDALRELGVPGDVPALVRLMGDPLDAVWGRAQTMVCELLKDPDVEAEVVRTARWGAEGAREHALWMLPAQHVDRLLPSLLADLTDDPSAEVRSIVASRLARLDRPETQDALFACLQTERDPVMASQLLFLLRRSRDERLLAPASRWLSDECAGRSAAAALASVGGRTATRLLRALLTDPATAAPTLAAAARAYGAMGRWDAVWLLLPLLDHDATTVHEGALGGLGSLANTGFRPWERAAVARALVARLELDTTLVGGLSRILKGLAEALPGLRELVDRTASPLVRAAALSLLDPRNATDAGTPHDLPLFVRHLDDVDAWVRKTAAEGIAHWVEETRTPLRGEERLRDRLTVLHSDPSDYVREAAAEALRALEHHQKN